MQQSVGLLLAACYTKRITLESLAMETGVSASQIKRMIREGKFNFTQIAEAVGYDSIYYFSSLFKKHTGKTLSEYARSLKD